MIRLVVRCDRCRAGVTWTGDQRNLSPNLDYRLRASIYPLNIAVLPSGWKRRRVGDEVLLLCGGCAGAELLNQGRLVGEG